MSAPTFHVFTTPAFNRSIKRLAKKDRNIPAGFDELLGFLQTDPKNVSRRHNIKKLIGVEQGDGQWRIRSGVYRLRYDIDGNVVTLHSINHRREAY